MIFQRLFRLYAHLYSAHFRQLEARNHEDVVDLNTSYLFFIVFALQYVAGSFSFSSPTFAALHH